MQGEWGTACTSNNLDNLELVDYDNGKIAFFDGKPDNDGDDDGMGGCKGVSKLLQIKFYFLFLIQFSFSYPTKYLISYFLNF